MQKPWTYEQLTEMRERLLAAIDQTEREEPEARGLPPMKAPEALALLQALAGVAQTRVWTGAEAFLHGQLLAAFRMGVLAEMLGYKGRCFVVRQEDMERASERE